MQTNPPLLWNTYVRLSDGTVHEQPPVCEACGGRGGGYDGDDTGVPGEGPINVGWCNCFACHGSGTAPHWHVQPAAGMLVRVGQQWGIVEWARPIHDQTGTGHILFAVAGQEYVPDPRFNAPLAPPPSCGFTLPQALVMLPGAHVFTGPQRIVIDHIHADRVLVAMSILWVDMGYRHGKSGLVFKPTEHEHTDTAPLRLALQRHDAVQQYIAGWAQEGK